ncbi:MAG: glutamate--tRNA ligase [Treponema sp.]|jgi:glutamyl-tRNA synthetase|nr:glutamate--tRNA ligase [Treponema sp.]
MDTHKSAGIRTRYAPSPTGLQHIGGVRTALFNYLFARSAGGAFILRLEDTDRSRSDPAFTQNLYDTFNWLGIRWDEGPDTGGPRGPYIQSGRFSLYRQYAHDLAGQGGAYYCFCGNERLEALRKAQEAAAREGGALQSGYDRRCRDLPLNEAKRRAAGGDPYTIRLKIPLQDPEGAALFTQYTDRLLGTITWKNEDINPDPVLLKSDGFPTYHLANVVDDHLMGISHVLRAQEWLPSTPLHTILYRAFGWDPPEFCHLPMVMGQDGKKLSKRHGAASVDAFRRQGYLPEALINYVALLGASYEEGKDIYTLQELTEHFSLEKLNKAPAVFDYKRLEWYNGQYLRRKTGAELAALALPFGEGLFKDSPPGPEETAAFIAAMPLIKERINLLAEIPEKIGYLFTEPPLPPPAEFFPKKSDLAQTLRLLRIGRDLVRPLATAAEDEAESLVKERAAQAGVKLGDLLMPLRVAVTGARISPPLFGSLRILGPDRALARVDRALAALSGAG